MPDNHISDLARLPFHDIGKEALCNAADRFEGEANTFLEQLFPSALGETQGGEKLPLMCPGDLPQQSSIAVSHSDSRC